jgi:hypothetical protein
VTESDRLCVPEKLGEYSGHHTAVFLTYGANLAFFEEALMHALRQKGCRNILIFMDATRYVDTITFL